MANTMNTTKAEADAYIADRENAAPAPGATSVPCIADDPKFWGGGVFKSRQGVLVMVEGSNGRGGHSLGGCTKDGKVRRVFQGPVEPGPYAFFTPACCVIDNYGGTRAILDRAEARGDIFRVKAGDVLQLAGDAYRVLVCRRGYASLEPVHEG
jgi:hypothetical protein